MHEYLWMHDLLQEMGEEIVRRESPEEHGVMALCGCHSYIEE